MNTLSLEKKTLILNSLVEGNSIRSTERLTGVTKKAITKLLVEAGEQAKEILDTQLVNIKSNFVQVDEIWTYVGKKQKQLREGDSKELGDQYVFVAMDAETKLVPAFRVGKRTMDTTRTFIRDLQYRIITRFQLSTDSFKPYFNVVDEIFGEDIDYGQIHKEYREDSKGEKRYSPAQIVRVIITPLIGQPVKRNISTSYIERQNLTMRMQMRRFTRLTNAFSKKLWNLECAVALHFYHYNFMRIHSSLRVTPAMQANITHRLWTWNDLLISAQMKKAA
ncbi:MAG: IS1 family transposase [Ignavibacteriales bacterium]|nr:IS1 family transposase [Ignavibacteriales bacterium]